MNVNVFKKSAWVGLNKTEIKITVYVSGYTETDTTGMLSRPSVWRFSVAADVNSNVFYFYCLIWSLSRLLCCVGTGSNVAARPKTARPMWPASISNITWHKLLHRCVKPGMAQCDTVSTVRSVLCTCGWGCLFVSETCSDRSFTENNNISGSPLCTERAQWSSFGASRCLKPHCFWSQFQYSLSAVFCTQSAACYIRWSGRPQCIPVCTVCVCVCVCVCKVSRAVCQHLAPAALTILSPVVSTTRSLNHNEYPRTLVMRTRGYSGEVETQLELKRVEVRPETWISGLCDTLGL
jgi:hypothetical protein